MEDAERYIIRRDIGHIERDRIIFTGTLKQCRICLTAMMRVAPRCEAMGVSFECDSPDGFRIRFMIVDEKPVIKNKERSYL